MIAACDVDARGLRPLGGSIPSAVPVILKVYADTPAARAGLAVGDTIWSIDGWSIKTLADLKHVLLRRTATGPARIVLGQPRGRRTVLVTPSGSPAKLGVSLPAVQVVEDVVQVYDVGRGLQVSAIEWAGMTLFAITAHNFGATPFELRPQAGIVPPGQDKQGVLYIGQDALVEPVTVRVTLSGRVYMTQFGRARR